MSSIKHKILVLSGKGGVGKSTVSAQIAFTLASRGFVVGVLDIDICGPSIPRMMGCENGDVHQSSNGWTPVYTNLPPDSEGNLYPPLSVMSIGFLLSNKDDAVIWRGPRKNALIKQFLTDVDWGNLDYLVIDTPPGTSDEHISIVQFLSDSNVDGAIVVTTPQEVSLAAVRKEIHFCEKTKMPVIGVIENMGYCICPHCKGNFKLFEPQTGGAGKMCADLNCPLIGSIPIDPVVAAACDAGASLTETLKGTGVAVETALNGIIDEIIKRTENSGTTTSTSTTATTSTSTTSTSTSLSTTNTPTTSTSASAAAANSFPSAASASVSSAVAE